MTIQYVNPHLHFDKVTLMEPLKNQFLLLATEVDITIFPFHLHTAKRRKGTSPIAHASTN